jgi:hypothetical protein
MDTAASTPRDPQGRFTQGNPGGPGRPPGRGTVLRRAAEEAITPEHVAAIIRKATRMALEGNPAAMRLVLERVCGRAPDAPADGTPIYLPLPQLRTAANCALAIDRLAEAICDGRVDRDGAKVMLDVIQARLKAIEVNDLEERLAELEKQAANVDFGTGRR